MATHSSGLAGPEPLASSLSLLRITRKISSRALVGSALTRICNPVHLWKALVLQWHRKTHRGLYSDTCLSFYHQMLDSDFLHYGYFDDPKTRPEDISLAALTAAQGRYAELLVEMAGNPAEAMLDVGCGVGGLSRLLRQRGFSPTALTPDRMQAAFVAKLLPTVPVICCKFEQLPAADYTGRFGTVFTAESLQYLKLDRALEVMGRIVKPGGKWVASDYFLSHPSADRTCHDWQVFQTKIAAAGWRIAYQRDITPHVLPTLAFIHMLAMRFGIPLLDFAKLRLRRKQPGLNYLLQDTITMLENAANDNLKRIDPAQFALDRQYMLLAMERSE